MRKITVQIVSSLFDFHTRHTQTRGDMLKHTRFMPLDKYVPTPTHVLRTPDILMQIRL